MNRSNRWSSVFLVAALLALAAVAPAQDRGRGDRGDRGDRPSRSRAHRDDRRGGGRWTDRGGDRTADRSDGRDPFGYSRSGDRSRGDRPGNGGRPPERFDYRGHVSSPVRFGPPPRRSALAAQINVVHGHVDGVAVGAQIGGLRIGYVSYGDRSAYGFGFGFPYYAYDPFAPNVVVVASPWYRYSYLPPYIDHTHAIVVHDYPDRWDWSGWTSYERRRQAAIDDALDDLRDAFEENSTRVAERLVPEDGDVAIFNDGQYDYSLNPDDFEKMLLDGVDQSRTRRYEILDVRTRGDEVRIRARHTYLDSWDKEQSVVHMITLRRENGGDYVIREFGTE